MSAPATRPTPPAASARATPLPFPSYLDPDEDIAKIKAPANYPSTPVFFDRQDARLRAPGRLPARSRPRRRHAALPVLMAVGSAGLERAGARRRPRTARGGLPRASRASRSTPTATGAPRGAAPRGSRRTGARHLPDAHRAGQGRRSSGACASARHAADGASPRPCSTPPRRRRAAGARRIGMHAQTDASGSMGVPATALRRRARRGASSTWGWRSTCRERLRVDPLTGLKSIIAAGRASRPAAASSRPSPSTPRRTRSSTATRTARRPRCGRCAPGGGPPDTARPSSCARCQPLPGREPGRTSAAAHPSRLPLHRPGCSRSRR